ncbi:MAG: hypothetical protein AYK19_21185 [Theionarchaea archaeon DG-70-1]|nr:MAG: hypothetical protein AYK19_21185 [Theionarchaea archaeon DG-70-1]
MMLLISVEIWGIKRAKPMIAIVILIMKHIFFHEKKKIILRVNPATSVFESLILFKLSICYNIDLFSVVDETQLRERFIGRKL